uniref:Alpha-2-macroglobulin bait region domain-containing protein n=1 Tax=Esox lucius TaxID=8010 RepID=A0A3P8YIN4_ESOLU
MTEHLTTLFSLIASYVFISFLIFICFLIVFLFYYYDVLFCFDVFICVIVFMSYLVTIPAVIPAGLEARFCASLLQPKETLVMTISLIGDEQNSTLLRESSDQEFHRCFQFQAPQLQVEKILKLKVEVRGETFVWTEERKVKIKPYSLITFVQTDKPIYNPGQIVHFRVITLDTSFRPVNQLVSDVNENRIGQWLNTTSSSKILQLSHPLNSEAPKGTYKVVVWIDGKSINHRFKVEQYVLPKFEIKLNLRDEISVGEEEYKVEVCAKYTYGQPVPGIAEVELCRPLDFHISSENDDINYTQPCHKESVEMDQTGCASHVFNLLAFKDESNKLLIDNFLCSTKVEEQGTEKRITFSYVLGKLSFVDTPKIYEHGSIVEGKIKAVHFNDTPISDMSVYLLGSDWSSLRHLLNLTTDIHGIASFSLNTTGMPNEDIDLIISSTPEFSYGGYRTPYFDTGKHKLSVIRPAAPDSKTSSYLDIQKTDQTLACGQEVSIPVQYVIVGETASSGAVDVIYLALSRGAIVDHGYRKVIMQDSSVTEGEVTFDLAVVPEMAPVVQILVYSMLPSGTIIAHSMNFPTEKCFRNKVSVEFSPSNAVPGEKNTLQLSALPGSLCGLSAVDKSVHIMEPGKRLDAGKIFNILPVTEANSFDYDLEDPSDCLQVRLRRYILPHPRPNREKNSAYEVFKVNCGISLVCFPVFSVGTYRTYYLQSHPEYSMIHGFILDRSRLIPTAQIVQMRTFFPETWIWDLVEVGESGSADVSLTVPDTITTWETEAFCLAPGGFGLAPPVELTVFQPFFLEITLPYSIIRGENFDLKATVFNYLSKCIMVAVTPAPSLDYTLTPLNDVQYSSCLCANERKTFSWTMSPSVLGVLNVTISAEAVQSHAACDNEIVSVPERGHIDIVTRSLLVKAEGTEETKTYNWLLCPSGQYSLTEEVELQLPMIVVEGSARASVSVLGDILGRALKNLDGLLQMPYGCGEQNMALLAPNIYILEYLRNTEQLTSAIRDKATKFLTSGYQRQLNYKHSDGAYSTFGQGSGNTWLTAFVLRSFSKAQSFIYIDPLKIKETTTWLEEKQKENGCFLRLGELFNNRMKGGVSDEVTLTAYITASMLESNMSVSDPVVNSSLSCLRNSTSDLSNTYTTALLAYTFTLAGDMEMRTLLLQHLDKIALQEGGLLHWNQTSSETSASLAVEISSYVLLASLSASPLSTADLGYSSRIVRWLVKQQNSYGGFSSTQDTVVALQALSLYSTKVFSKEGSSTVTVKSPSGGQNVFDVNQNNKLLYQERQLQDVAGKYTVEVKGSACASVQLSQHYNIPTPTVDTSLSIQVIPEVECNSDTKRKIVSLDIVQQLPVKNLKPAVVKIYDYYQPSKFISNPLQNVFSFSNKFNIYANGTLK